MAHPGKKLLFMGQEFGQFIEWNYEQQLDWMLLDYDSHRKLQQFTKDLNRFYLKNSPMWEIDDSWDGFQWLVHDDNSQCIVAMRRSNEDGNDVIAICNFTPVERDNYRIGIPKAQDYVIALNSDDVKYGGSGVPEEKVIEAQEQPMHGKTHSIVLTIPPLSVLYLCPKDGMAAKGGGLVELQETAPAQQQENAGEQKEAPAVPKAKKTRQQAEKPAAAKKNTRKKTDKK